MMNDNPIYLHLTHNFRRTSGYMDGLLYVVVVVIGVATAVGLVYAMHDLNAASNQCYINQPLNGTSPGVCPADVLLLVIWFSGIGFTIVASSLALIVTVLSTSKNTPQEGLSELWLTPISARQIVDGYIGAVVYRLRILGVIGISLVPLAIVIRESMWGRRVYMLPGPIPAILETGVLSVIGILLFRMAIATGVWVGFRRRGRARLAIPLVSWIVFISIVLGLFEVMVWEAADTIYMIHITYEMKRSLLIHKEYTVVTQAAAGVVVAVAILWSLNRFARWCAYRAGEKMRQMQ